MTDQFRAICAELVDALENARRIIKRADGTLHINTAEFALRRARALLAQPVAEGPTDEEPDAFAIVQMRLDDLAGDQELMLYRWPNGEWSIDHTNPTSSVQLGEVSGKYGSTGRTLEEAVCNLAELLPTPEATND